MCAGIPDIDETAVKEQQQFAGEGTIRRISESCLEITG